jgi:hypothetical protein
MTNMLLTSEVCTAQSDLQRMTKLLEELSHAQPVTPGRAVLNTHLPELHRIVGRLRVHLDEAKNHNQVRRVRDPWLGLAC